MQSLEASSSLNAIPNPMSYYSGPAEDPEVSMGIFPASHIHVRDQLPDAEGRLAEVYSRTITAQADAARNHTGMATLREEDESLYDPDQKSDSASSRPKSPRGPRARPLSFPHIHIDTPGPILNTADTSALYSSAKPPPPRPSLKSGDETMSGVTQPLIDEIASALREWHSLMFKHLERRDYRLFEIVKEHIEALHLCRRQLLTQALSAEETANLRRECVARLVRGNVAQELDVIVRHPTFGGLVTVDTDGEPDPRSWLSAIRMFAMQVSLAYIENDAAGATQLPKSSALSATDGSRRLSISMIPPSPNHLPLSYPFTGEPLKPSGSPSTMNGGAGPRQAAPFFHIYIEFRAFVASLCSPNETAELYFSLYNKNLQQFLTEEFCAILNHNGVMARNSDGKGQPGHIRTLFRDLGERDAQDDIYLVCRIVRNGAMKLGSTSSSSGINGQRRGSEPLMNHGNDSRDSASLSNGRHSVSASRPTGTDTFPSMFRRPFGAAVLELGFLKSFSREESESTPATEHVLPIFVPTNEATYSTLHQDLIGSNTKDFEKSQRCVVCQSSRF
jgi:dedicator of cytokinesis protein 3